MERIEPLLMHSKGVVLFEIPIGWNRTLAVRIKDLCRMCRNERKVDDLARTKSKSIASSLTSITCLTPPGILSTRLFNRT